MFGKMGVWRNLIIVFLSLNSFSGCRADELTSTDEYLSGVVIESLPDSIYYSTYIPVVYEFVVPTWNVTDLSLNTSIKCTHDGADPDIYCPLVFHLQESIKIFGERLSVKTSLLKAVAPSPSPYSASSFNCDDICSHFDKFTQTSILDYLNQHDNCELASELVHTKLNYKYPYEQHTKLLDALKNINFALEDINWSSTHKFMKLAIYSSLQEGFLLSRFIESDWWATGMSTCLQDSRLSVYLVDPSSLNDTLLEVSRMAKRKNYVLSLPETYQQLSSYYRLPLTDCALNLEDELTSNGKDRFIVRVLIPVRKSNKIYRQVQLNKIPFLITEDGRRKVCQVKGFQSQEKFLVETETAEEGGNERIIPTANSICKPNELCKIPNRNYHLEIHPCIRALFLKSQQLINESCSFECFPWKTPNTPIVTQLSSNKYAITGNSSADQIFVTCGGRPNVVLTPNSTGTLVVTLPCACHIVLGSQTFVPRTPCSASLDVKYIYISPNSNRETGAHTDQVLDEIIHVSGDTDTDLHPHHTSHSAQLVFIWIFLLWLLASNAYMIYSIYYAPKFTNKAQNVMVELSSKQESTNSISTIDSSTTDIIRDQRNWFASFDEM